MGWRDVRKKIKRQFSEVMELPGDVVLDLPKITLIGNIQLFIENHRGIIEYSTERVRISAGNGEVTITGDNLLLRNILPEELCIEGRLKSVSFL
ncbi:MAG: sporulation protein YqfC [Peptococcaceae bacterium]|nr:sporulation protein YqfC [Peptococcaceae bacterium]